MPHCFVTGTDTGVGKTLVTALIACHWRHAGHDVALFKPFATGARREGGRWTCEDTEFYALALECAPDPAWLGWCAAQPAAPPVAAGVAGETVPVEAMSERARRLLVGASDVVIEGIGGLLCPLDETHTVADFAAPLAIPLVIVARAALGTMNHTLLTLEAAAARRLPVAGVVFNGLSSEAENASLAWLCARLSVPCLGVLPQRGAPGAVLAPADLDLLARHFDFAALESGAPTRERG